MSDDGTTVRMRMFGPFHSNAASTDQQDIDVTQQVLDVIESEVGERPCDYVLDIGGERRWDPETHSWRDAPMTAAVVPLSPNPG